MLQMFIYTTLHMQGILTHVKWFKRVFKILFVLAKLTDHTIKQPQDYTETADATHLTCYENINFVD